MPPVRRDYDVRSVERAEVLRYLGYAGQPVTPELDARIDEVVASCLATCRPCGATRVFDVAGHGERDGVPVIELAGTALSLEGRSIAEHLDGAVAVGVLAVTAGMGVEAELRRLSLTDRLAQVIFDAAGTAAVERAADAAEADVVAEAAARGLHCGTRFSPGYGDLPLSTQPVLLGALDAGAPPGHHALARAPHVAHQERHRRGRPLRAPAPGRAHQLRGLPLPRLLRAPACRQHLPGIGPSAPPRRLRCGGATVLGPKPSRSRTPNFEVRQLDRL